MDNEPADSPTFLHEARKQPHATIENEQNEAKRSVDDGEAWVCMVSKDIAAAATNQLCERGGFFFVSTERIVELDPKRGRYMYLCICIWKDIPMYIEGEPI